MATPTSLSQPHLRWWRQLPQAAQLEEAARLLDALDRARGPIPQDECDALIEALNGIPPAVCLEWASRREPAPASLYVRARLLTTHEDAGAAADAWEQLLTHAPAPDAMLNLHAARALTRAGNAAAGGARLRLALSLRPPYPFFVRAQKLVADLSAARQAGRRELRIAVLGASTTSLLTPVLRALCFREGIAAEFYEGLYGAYRQEIWDAGSGLYRFEPTITFIASHWRELALPPLSDEAATVGRIADEYESLWRALHDRLPTHIVQHAFDLPGYESHDHVAAARTGGRTRCIELVNLELARRAPAFVSILDTPGVQAVVGRERWHDVAQWHTARQHPSMEALPALAEEQMAHVRAVSGLTRKLLVCDLDNTLWGGIIGEDGLNGIRIGPDHPIAEAYLGLQEYLLELKDRGVLLAVVSKNNDADARLPFEQHPHMRLRLDDFAAFIANWDDKANNIRTVAELVGLGTDSFVFLDDNPFERAWIRSQLPEVAVVELGPTPYTYVTDLDRGRHFFSLTLTEEDRQRAEQYRREAAREALRHASSSMDDFLKELQMRGADEPIGSANLARVTQLVNKTNQFNLTTRRHSTAEIDALATHPRGWARAFRLTDRFGDHGLIGVLLCASAGDEAWEIDTWVMSCRVLGRGMERFMFDRTLTAARKMGVRRIVGVYRPTPRNGQVADLYSQLGFARVESSDGSVRYELDLAGGAIAPAHSIAPVPEAVALSS
jgi:FkbH-like protein